MKVAVEGICKRFGSVQANDSVSLGVPEGRILGILGENGAGKSTLMKILSGFYQPDAGRIMVEDRPVIFRSPADALKAGIGMLHQDPMDFPCMTVEENFLTGRSGLRQKQRSTHRQLQYWCERLGFELKPHALVETLTVGERQQLELVRLLALGAQLLILDEPTTGISALQKNSLFGALMKLAEEGHSIVLVSHKLRDVEALCHEVVVLRAGRKVGHRARPFDLDDLVQLMFEREIRLAERRSLAREEISLQSVELALEWRGIRIGPVTVDLRAGEVIGLAGMEGSGQNQFLRACCGLVRPVGGKLLRKGRDLAGSSYGTHRRNGIAFAPAARLEEGLVPELTLAEHMALLEPAGKMTIRWPAVSRATEDRIARYNIRGVPDSAVGSLSGGNQQRALIAFIPKWADVLLLEHPTRGLDVESANFIWAKLMDRCATGTSVLFISADLEEILQNSDRILVFCGGQVFGPILAAETNIEQLGSLIGGRV